MEIRSFLSDEVNRVLMPVTICCEITLPMRPQDIFAALAIIQVMIARAKGDNILELFRVEYTEQSQERFARPALKST